MFLIFILETQYHAENFLWLVDNILNCCIRRVWLFNFINRFVIFVWHMALSHFQFKVVYFLPLYLYISVCLLSYTLYCLYRHFL